MLAYPILELAHEGTHPSAPSTPMNMSGAPGSDAMARDASGTSWQPDSTRHAMGHAMHGDWMLMGHTMLNAVYDRQQGPRGDELAFVAGMVMGSARRDVANGDALTLRATWSWRVGEKGNAFLYAGLPGEPAFGPPAFMHRSSMMMSPEAPITHHGLDSTHITFGVITAGWVRQQWKFEVSQFTGREPDEDRYDIEKPRLDSTATRRASRPAPSTPLRATTNESGQRRSPGGTRTRAKANRRTPSHSNGLRTRT